MVVLEEWAASINGPAWFHGYDILFQVFFIFISLLIYSMSIKAYKISRERNVKNLGFGFFFIALGYLIYALGNVALYTEFYDGVVRGINFANLIFFASIFFLLIGYSVLLLVSLKVRSKRIALLMFAFILLFIAFSYQYYLKFHIVSFMLLLFITYNFLENYVNRKKFNAGLVFSSFYMLTMAEIMYVAIIIMPTLYVLAHIFEMIGYLLMAWVYVRVLKNG